MNQTETFEYLPEFVEKMKRESIPAPVIEAFKYYYQKTVLGDKGLLYDKDLSPIKKDEVRDARELEEYAHAGRSNFHHAAVIVLNGGLGTSMGLTGPKSLLEARGGRTFLEILLNQSEKCHTTLVLMNSFSTEEETRKAVSRIKPEKPPLMFVQNKFPKILRKNFAPAAWAKNPLLEWNPPGHGDIYMALNTSGMLEELLNRGISYVFVSNLDNLGAKLDAALLGYFIEKGFPFMMEVSDRTPADMKGGHLARYRKGGLVLREIAQCPDEEKKAFSDINRYCFFNTNNLWINLRLLKEFIRQNDIRLPMILNAKNIDPRDKFSPEVYQIETAMGAAISFFENASIVKVPRSRFYPVKKCNELLAIRSDCFQFSDEGGLSMNPERRNGDLKINLDPEFYGKFDQLEERFKDGVPSLLDCLSLTVTGDVRFEKDVKIIGNVRIENRGAAQAVIKAGRVIDSNVVF
jgi:UTP--glucose-1-phosphate uridylyltransferase